MNSKLNDIYGVMISAARLLIVTFSYIFLYAVRRIFSRQGKEEVQGEILEKWFFTMGPLYIKVGQILATQTSIFPKAITKRIESTFDRSPASSKKYIFNLLDRSYGGNIESVFSEFDYEPIACGSVAQVHKAVLVENDQSVAVKIVKENVKRDLKRALSLISYVINLLHFLIPPLRKYHVKDYFLELEGLLYSQAYMLSEMENQFIVIDNFGNHPYITIPTPFPKYCNDEILVMEFISGIPGYKADEIKCDKSMLSQRLQTLFNTMAYYHGVFHLDPHPGNISFTEDGNIILYDFGLVGFLTEPDKFALASFYFACIRHEWPLAVSRFTKQFVIVPQGNTEFLASEEEYAEKFTQILRDHFEITTNQWSTLAFINQANTLFQSYGARISIRLTSLASSLLTGEGFLTMVDEEVDIWENSRVFTDQASPYMSEEVQARFDAYFGEHTPSSIRERKAIHDVLIAPTHLDRYFLPSAYPIVVKEGKGCEFRDLDGLEYIDLSCGYGPNILGFSPTCVEDKIIDAVKDGSINALANQPEMALARKIVDAFPGADRVIFSNSGTESVLMAIRLCRAFTGRDRVAKFEGHFHGWSDQGLVSSWFLHDGELGDPKPMTGSKGSHAKTVEDTLILQYGHPDAFQQIVEAKDHLSCVVIEPLLSSMAIYHEEFLLTLREVCTRHNIPLVFDEVVTGFRVAYGGFQRKIGIEPDVTCLGKIIGGGLPLGAVVGKASIMEVARSSQDPYLDIEERTFVGGTMSGNSICCAAGLATLEHLCANQDIYEKLDEKSQFLARGMADVCQEKGIPFQITTYGSIFSMAFGSKKPKYYRQKMSGTNFKANLSLSYYMRKQGIYLPELHTLMLNSAHQYHHLEKVIAGFSKSLDEMIGDGLFAH